jgi:hypothetical protein
MIWQIQKMTRQIQDCSSHLAHAPICAGHQGPYWRSGLWCLDQQGQLQYFHTDQNAVRAAMPTNRESWAPDQNSVGANAPAAPTQLAACMNIESYDGRATAFALSGGNLYYTTQLSRYLSQDDKDVSGWTSWTMLQSTTKLKLICACPYTYGLGQVVTTGSSVWGVGEDGVLRFAMVAVVGRVECERAERYRCVDCLGPRSEWGLIPVVGASRR